MFDDVLTLETRALLEDLNHELDRLGFYPAGGSGLALQLGHRISEDLDFFTVQGFEPAAISRHLESRPGYREDSASPGTLHCSVDKVKLSFIHYPIPLVYPALNFGGTVVADWRDILAEKFKTLSQRGSRKDFYDIYVCFTLGGLSIGDGVRTLRRRFGAAGLNYYHVLKSLGYFADADAEPELTSLKPVSWETVKAFFAEKLKEFEQHLLAEES